MKKRLIVTISLFLALLVIPAISVSAYGNTFNFNLRYGTDNDNAQSDAGRYVEFTLEDFANVFATSQSNASNNVQFKVLYKNDAGSILGNASNYVTYKSSYSSFTIPYYSQYKDKAGWFALYGRCTTGNATIAGTWTP